MFSEGAHLNSERVCFGGTAVCVAACNREPG